MATVADTSDAAPGEPDASSDAGEPVPDADANVDAAAAARELAAAKLAAQTVQRQLKMKLQQTQQQEAPLSTKLGRHRRAATAVTASTGKKPDGLPPLGKKPTGPPPQGRRQSHQPVDVLSTDSTLLSKKPSSPPPQAPASPPPQAPASKSPSGADASSPTSSSSAKNSARWRRSRRTQSSMITTADPIGALTTSPSPAAPLRGAIAKKGAKSLPRPKAKKRRALSTLMTSAFGGAGALNPIGALTASSSGVNSQPTSPRNALSGGELDFDAVLPRPTSPPPTLSRGAGSLRGMLKIRNCFFVLFFASFVHFFFFFGHRSICELVHGSTDPGVVLR